MSEIDITAESTAEEISEYVDKVVAEVEEERTPEEEKPDAQIITETAEPAKEPKKETKEPKETAVVEDKTDDEKPADESPEWLDDDMKAEIAAYGLKEEELSDFASREDVERVLNLFDSRFKAEETKEPGDEKDESEEKPEVQEGQYKVSLDTDIYDEEIVGEFNRMRDHYESRLDAIEARYAEDDARASEERFDRTIDGLGATDIFGKTGEESKKELERRKAVIEDVRLKLDGLKRAGKTAEMTEAMVLRSARGIFADEFDKKLLKKHTRRISRQSNGRQGGGATRPQDPREDPRDAADALYKELSGA